MKKKLMRWLVSLDVAEDCSVWLVSLHGEEEVNEVAGQPAG
jgi:hypothetical protein